MEGVVPLQHHNKGQMTNDKQPIIALGRGILNIPTSD
jgi:hypothetical protein